MVEKRILIVEDEGIIANGVATALGKSGYSVLDIASSGEEALYMLQFKVPDLVLMDIRLKGELDGLETARLMHTNHTFPIIFLTSHTDAETRLRAKESNPYGYLVKPVRTVGLCAAVEMALHKAESDIALRKHDEWLATILDSAADAIIVADANGSVEFLNHHAEELLGHKTGEIRGWQWNLVAPLFHFHSGAPADDFVSLSNLKLTTIDLPYGMRLRRGPDADIVVAGEVSPAVLYNGIVGSIIVLRDISKRAQEEAEVRREQSFLLSSRLAGGIADEFGNLLSLIVAMVRTFRTKTEDPQDLTQLNALLDAAATLAEIMEKLSSLAGTNSPECETLKVNARVKSALQKTSRQLNSGVRVHLEIDPKVQNARLNGAQFEKALVSLLRYSEEAMPGGGEITVATSERAVNGRAREMKGDFLSIVVRSSGGELSPELQEHIFEPFYRRESVRDQAGLGLAVAYAIIKSSGGDITVQSSPGFGIAFEIVLPHFTNATEKINNGKAPPRTILFIENHQAIRTLIHNFFEKQGFNLIEADDGHQALRIAGMFEGTIDLLIGDISLSDQSGPGIAGEIVASRPGMKTLFLSGRSGEPADWKGQLESGTGFLQKPFTLESLLTKVRDLLG
jgi:two-component system, cell cycle sensor histidine kinase and response regulator CckA